MQLIQLEDQGIIDFEEYFASNPDELKRCCENMGIVECNQAALHFFGAKDVEELSRMHIYLQSQELMNAKLRLLIAFKKRLQTFEEEIVFKSVDGTEREALLK